MLVLGGVGFLSGASALAMEVASVLLGHADVSPEHLSWSLSSRQLLWVCLALVFLFVYEAFSRVKLKSGLSSESLNPK